MWLYQGKPFTSDMIGTHVAFVYIITHRPSGRFYVGKKVFQSRRSKMVKGKKKRTIVESDWQKYYGSSEELKEAIKHYGADTFTREILHLCPNKGTANYLEAKEQFTRDVLIRDDSFNNWIMCKCHRSHIRKTVI
jgi:hypothetical protein